MFSYEDRLRAVRLYIKLGLRVGSTIRQLGYPTKNSLKSWHQEYMQRHELAAGYGGVGFEQDENNLHCPLCPENK